MSIRRYALVCALVLAGLVPALARPAAAQVSTADRRCITTFNKNIRKVAKIHGQIVKKCLSSFAGGRLTSSTPEACIASDPGGKLASAVADAAAKIGDACAATPGFGVSDTNTALIRAVLSRFDLMHGSFGSDLDTALIPVASDAQCQSKIGAALLKCSDTRLKAYLKCQKRGLVSGQISDAASLAASCLGSGGNPQPDDDGRIALKCGTAVANSVSLHCTGTDLQAAFAPCDTSDAINTAACLGRVAGCQMCRLLNDVDALSRDCDLFDDGNGSNGTCGAECADGLVNPAEGCDDSNTNDGDGCSSSCTVEAGWTCTGEPSSCTQNCGNGVLDAGEACDDHDTTGGDGCSSTCEIESGWTCSGEPSVCVRHCGNGVVEAGEGEVCDDGDMSSGDGCSSTCQVEGGYNCSGQPSTCTFVCGNGTFQAGETCDDGDAAGGDGCSAICQIETGWLCSGAPSLCGPLCGDGLIRGNETCDDDNTSGGDGCSSTCQVETGFQCSSEPSHCLAVCGDGFIRGFENCDDTNTASNDGCSGNFCRKEVGFDCSGQPSVCNANCGDGNTDVPEECDDGGNTPGDGCAANCTVENGWACGGTPSVCGHTCGNGLLNASETCDDGNTVSGDGCSASCRNETGWVCTLPGFACQRFEVFIDSPANGIFSTNGTITISGHYTTLLPGQASVTVNGVAADTVNPLLRTFSHTMALNQGIVFNPALVKLTNTSNGDDTRDRVVVIAGPSITDGSYSVQGVALRINDSGLDSMESVVASLAGGQLNIGELLPAGTVILPESCFINFIGCLGSASATIANPPPSYGALSIALDSRPNVVFADIGISNLRIDVNINGSGLVPSCGLRLTAAALHLTGNYSLEPKVGSPSNVDVSLVGDLGVVFNAFNHDFTSGLCDAPIIGDIIEAFLPDLQQTAIDGIKGFLSDPDGSGPQDSPIAAAIENVLSGVSISGAIGSGLGLQLDSPLFEVAEDNAGITLGADAKFTVSVGSGPGQCIPPVGAPDFSRSYAKTSSFPVFGANTPAPGNIPYGLGISLSTSAFNQLLRGQTECGLMRTSLTSIDLDGAGGNPPLPVTSSLLSLLVPEFGQLPANTPLRIDIAPTIAPVVTGNAGPAGELTELKIAQVSLKIVQPGPETVWLSGALDARLGLNLAFLPDGSGLAITIGTPAVADIAVAILGNPLGANATQVESVLPAVVTPLIPQLAGAISGFPLPQFFGLSLHGVEVSRQQQFLSLYANLAPAP